MPHLPLAFHITISTFGTRLHGDPRGTVDRDHNAFGEPVLPTNVARQARERSLQQFPAVILLLEQCRYLEEVGADIATRGGWTLHTIAAAADHLHALISADAEGAVVRRLWKRWLSQALSQRWSLAPGAKWWADGGSVKWIWDDAYLRIASEYIANQSTAAIRRNPSMLPK